MRELLARSLATAALVLGAQVASGQTMYRVVPLHPGDPIAIDSSGKVLLCDADATCYICSKSRCRALSDRYPPSRWRDFNDQGVLTGYSDASALRKDPRQGGGAQVITHGFGLAIAPDGSGVGTDENSRAFLYTDRRIPLKGLAGGHAAALDINSRHEIVGHSLGVDDREHATMWVEGGPPLDLGIAPEHGSSRALAINEAGVAVGYSYVPTNAFQPARFVDGSVQILQVPIANAFGMAMDINAAGTIVGLFSDGEVIAGIVEGDRMVDLNTRLRPVDALVYSLLKAVAINGAGQIAAMHIDPQTGRGVVVRLDPIQ